MLLCTAAHTHRARGKETQAAKQCLCLRMRAPAWMCWVEKTVSTIDYPTLPRERAFVYISGRQFYCIIYDPCDCHHYLLPLNIVRMFILLIALSPPSFTLRLQVPSAGRRVTNQYKRASVLQGSEMPGERVFGAGPSIRRVLQERVSGSCTEKVSSDAAPLQAPDK